MKVLDKRCLLMGTGKIGVLMPKGSVVFNLSIEKGYLMLNMMCDPKEASDDVRTFVTLRQGENVPVGRYVGSYPLGYHVGRDGGMAGDGETMHVFEVTP